MNPSRRVSKSRQTGSWGFTEDEQRFGRVLAREFPKRSSGAAPPRAETSEWVWLGCGQLTSLSILSVMIDVCVGVCVGGWEISLFVNSFVFIL